MKKEQKNVSLPIFGIPKLLPYLRPYRKTVIRMVLLALVCSVIDVCYPLFNRYALDHFVAGNTLEGLPAFIVIYILVLAFQSVINDRSMVDSGTVEMSIDRDLRNKAFNHLQTLSFSYFNQNSVGYIHARVMSDTGKIGEAVSWRMMDCIWNGSYILFAIVVMMMTQLRLALWMIFLLAAAGALISLFQNKLISVNRKIRELNSRITGDFNEGITGAKTIKLLSIEGKMQEEFREDTENIRRESVHAVRYSAMLISTVTLMSSVALAVVLWQGGMLTREGIIKIGTLSVFVSYAVGMVEPLQFIIQNISAFIAIQANIERLTGLLEEPAKSTLVNLVCRFYEPTEGTLLIDGRDARERSQLWLHSHIGYVLQTPHLFSGSVRENLRYGRPEATDEEIMKALDMVSAGEIVERMGGLDSDVGEGGSHLSTGEKQLLSFARALLADPVLLILDEATSSVDTLTEKAIQKAISVVTRGRTSFVIAHRLSTITKADLILAVRDGKIEERGTHLELMKKKGYYYSLYSRQYEESILG